MPGPLLADFIHRERLRIVAAWEAFARTLLPAAGGMNAVALRDHADEILTVIVADMKTRQSVEEQAEKSKGRGEAQRLEAIGQVHAALRIENGFKLGQIVAEYRALRASVLRLWEDIGSDPGGVTRFNEAVDEAMVEAVDLFTVNSECYRDQTLGILGHDLRNPLAGIVTGATLLMSSDALDDRTVRIAARMLNSANRMSRMISDLLDLTRTRSGHPIPVVPIPTDLDPLCRQVVAELEGLRSVGGLRFTALGDLQAECDADRISQVISNLLRNAIQHGGSSDAITLVADGTGNDILLSVHNGGAVIPSSVQCTMFEPMVRQLDTDGRNPGVGLGLYIAAQVMLAHGGELTLVSTDAEGTTFSARLPRSHAAKS